MQKYQIIARKFRPQRFAEVVGQDPIVTTLKNGLISGRIGQAYLFCGGRGCGKTTLARLFAKALCCKDKKEDAEPCLCCENCQEIAEGKSLNVLEIDGASNRSIDDVRKLSEMIGYAPMNSPYKVYIIDEVHMLTKEAFNALLKILEEPPSHAKFFFATTEPHKIPQTIISRCQRFNLQRISSEALEAKLSFIAHSLGIEVEPEALSLISTLSEGSLRDAESLLDQLICFGQFPITSQSLRTALSLLSEADLIRLDEAISTQNQDLAHLLAEHLFRSGKDLPSLIDELLSHFRLHLLVHLGKKQLSSPLYHTSGYTKPHLIEILHLLLEWQKEASKTSFKQVHLEMLLLSLVKSDAPSSLPALIERLLDLEQRIKPTASSTTTNTEKSDNSKEKISLSLPKEEKIKKEKIHKEETQIEPQKVAVSEKILMPLTPTMQTTSSNAQVSALLQDKLPASALKEEMQVEPQKIAASEKILVSSASTTPTPSPTLESKPKEASRTQAEYQTLMRFAAVELEGTINTKGA